MKIGCIIPARNEQDRIPRVLRAAADANVFAAIAVVDDGSEDYTLLAARDTILPTPPEYLNFYSLYPNLGKSTAIGYALTWMPGCDAYCLLDADLEGVTAANIQALVAPVALGLFPAAVSIRGNCPRIYRKFDVLTGERVLPGKVSILADVLRNADSMACEMILNEWMIGQGLSIAAIPWPNVRGPLKCEKYGFRAGIREEFKMYRDLWRRGIRDLHRQTVGLYARTTVFSLTAFPLSSEGVPQQNRTEGEGNPQGCGVDARQIR